MPKQLLGSICLVALAAGSLALWETPAPAADARTTEIVPGPRGPVFAEENVEISAGQSVQWIPRTNPGVPHHLVQKMPNGAEVEITKQFNNPDTAAHAFESAGVAEIQCTVHRGTMNQTITVK
jgi:plastocyanin